MEEMCMHVQQTDKGDMKVEISSWKERREARRKKVPFGKH